MNQMDHFSVSQLQTYLNCPASYYYGYVEKLDWEFQPADMILGKICHQAIADYHRSSMTKQETVKQFAQSWDKLLEKTDNLRFRSLDSVELTNRGEQLIKLYCEQFKSLNPEEVEMFFEIPLLDLATGQFGNQIVQGRIDLISDSTVYEIKTSSRSANQDQADSSLQLTFYAWAYQYLFSQPAKQLKLIVLVKTKQPKIQVLTTTRTTKDFTRLYHLMTGAIEAINKNIFYPNLQSKFGCQNCQFKNACLDKTGGDDNVRQT